MALYSSRFEVGAGGAHEFLWLPAMLLLLPGLLIGYVADGLNFSNVLGRWYGAPLFVIVVLVNAACWNGVILLTRRRRPPLQA